MRAARPYAERIAGITANLSKANPEYRSPYMREITKTGGNVGFIVLMKRV
jgi:F-type H+-transporting ATPase subunit gamma